MVNFIFNPGTENFEIFLKSKIIVDKTELIYYLNKVVSTPKRFICVSRPRRFGKTTIANMLTAYYSFSEKKTEIFNNKKIAKIKRWDKYLGKLNVIKLNVSKFFDMYTVKDGLNQIRDNILIEVKEKEPEIKFKNEDNIVSIFEDIYKYTKKKIVLIIDEWDIILRYKRNDEVKLYLKFLNNITRDQSYIALAYITGILPTKKYGIQSSLDFDEYSMISSSWLSRFIGFTQNEIKKLIDNEKLDSDNNKHKNVKRNKELNNEEEIKCKKHVNIKEKKCEENISNKELINSNNIINKNQNENKNLINKEENKRNKKRKIKQSNHESKHKKLKFNKESINSNNTISKKQNENKNLINKKKNNKNKKRKSESNQEFEFKLNFKNIKKWYNGYRLYDEKKGKNYKLYTTYSIIKAFDNEQISNYWNRTEAFFAISEYINMDFFGLKEDIVRLKNGKSVKINIDSYQNDMTSFKCKDDVLTMLVHLGYLSYNAKTKKVCIPNKEVLQDFLYYTESENWTKIGKKLEKSKKLLKETLKCNEERVAELMEEFHDEACNKDYNSESTLRHAILFGYYVSDEYYNSFLELDSGKGYIDIAYIPYNLNSKYPALIVELKYEKNVETALDQIKKRRYPQKLKPYKSNMLLVSINYNKEACPNSKEYKHHTCTIEKFTKTRLK